MDADLELLLTTVFCTATISCPKAPRTRGEGSQTPRSSPSASPRRSWECRLIDVSSPSPESACAISSPSCPSSPASTSVVVGSPRRSNGSPASSPLTAPATTTTSSCWTRPRSSAVDRERRSSAPRSPITPDTATARATPASSGGFASISPALLTAPHGASLWSAPLAPSARSPSSCCPKRCTAARPSSATRATPRGVRPWGPRDRRLRPAAESQGRGRAGALAGTDPSADRVGVLDLQGHPLPRAPRRPHDRRSLRAGRGSRPRPRCMHLSQPPPWAAEPRAGRLRRLSAWNQSSRLKR